MYSDKEMLDWLDRQWMQGIHLEVCTSGSFSGGNLRKVATVYVSGADYTGRDIREAIEKAMKNT